MAVYFDGIDGNHNVTLDGAFNAGGPIGAGTWTPLFAGATRFGFVFTIQPDSIAGSGRLSQVNNGGVSAFHLYNANGQLVFLVFDQAQHFRRFTTTGPALTAGIVNRVTCRWQASPELMKIDVNGHDVTGTLDGTAITALIGSALANNAPLELGSASGVDLPCVPGIYQQWAIWNQYPSDADTAIYAATGDPAQMSIAPNTLYWVTLAQNSIVPVDIPSGSPTSTYATGHVRDARTGIDYAATTGTYNMGGGNYVWPIRGVFGLPGGSGNGAAIVADLGAVIPGPMIILPWALVGGVWQQVAAPVAPVWYQDPSLPILPQRALEEWEQVGGAELGLRGQVRAVPSAYASVQAAWDAAAPGDDIVIDHTATGLQGGLHAPVDKVIGPTTLRVPPGGRTRLSGATPLTG